MPDRFQSNKVSKRQGDKVTPPFVIPFFLSFPDVLTGNP